MSASNLVKGTAGLSPPCTQYTLLQNLCAGRIDPVVRQKRMEQAECLLNFAMFLAKLQHDEGRFFVHEHPAGATSWARPSVLQVRALPGVREINFDQCRLGLRIEGSPVKKTTKLLTNSEAVVARFINKRCNCTVPHRVIQGQLASGGSVAAHAAWYPDEMCRLLAEAAIIEENRARNSKGLREI